MVFWFYLNMSVILHPTLFSWASGTQALFQFLKCIDFLFPENSSLILPFHQFISSHLWIWGQTKLPQRRLFPLWRQVLVPLSYTLVENHIPFFHSCFLHVFFTPVVLHLSFGNGLFLPTSSRLQLHKGRIMLLWLNMLASEPNEVSNMSRLSRNICPVDEWANWLQFLHL